MSFGWILLIVDLTSSTWFQTLCKWKRILMTLALWRGRPLFLTMFGKKALFCAKRNLFQHMRELHYDKFPEWMNGRLQKAELHSLFDGLLQQSFLKHAIQPGRITHNKWTAQGAPRCKPVQDVFIANSVITAEQVFLKAFFENVSD